MQRVTARRARRLRYTSIWLLGALLSVFGFALNLAYHQRWGMQVIEVVQLYRSPALDTFMRLMSFAAAELFTLSVPFFLFYRGKVAALELIEVVTAIGLAMSVLKLYYREPRPWTQNPSIVPPLSTGLKEFSFPSGHSASCLVQFLWFRRNHARVGIPVFSSMFTLTGLFIVATASFSRVYFAVHYPHDIFAGWALGVLVHEVWSAMHEEHILHTHPRARLAVVCLLLLGAFYTLTHFDPADLAFQGTLGFCLGCQFGAAVARTFVFWKDLDVSPPRSPWWQRLLRFLIVAFIMALSLAAFAMGENHREETQGREEMKVFAGLALTAVLFLSPWVFAQMGLVDAALWNTYVKGSTIQ